MHPKGLQIWLELDIINKMFKMDPKRTCNYHVKKKRSYPERIYGILIEAIKAHRTDDRHTHTKTVSKWFPLDGKRKDR